MEKLTTYLAASYPWTLILLIVLYMIWYGMRLKQKKSLGMNICLFLSFVLYLASFYVNYGLQWFMIFWFIRDFILVFICGLLVKFVLRNKYLVIIVVVAACTILGFWYYKYDRLPFTSPKVIAFESNSSAELLVDIKDKSKFPELAKLLEPWKASVQLAFPQIKDTSETELDDYYTVDLNSFSDTLEVINKLIHSGLIDDVEFNEAYSLSPIELSNAMYYKTTIVNQDSVQVQTIDSVAVNDIRTSNFSSKSLNDPKIESLWAFNHMEIDNLIQYLKKAKPLRKAKIFILDTGVDALHEDLGDNYVSLVNDYDKDTGQHGTHCAGIASAVSNNKLGIASLNLTGKYTSVTSITVLPGGSGRQENIIDGIILAADNGADVISMSLGGASTDQRQKAYEKAIKYANDKGAIIIVAAGNENINAKMTVPASCNGVITVSAVDDELNKAEFSNFVTDLDYKLSAPGVKILSTTPGSNYQFLSGTSMATPYVSGLVGLMKAFQPSLTTAEVYKILNTTGKETKDTPKTGKFIQPLAALKAMDTKSTQASIVAFFGKFMSFKMKGR